MMKILNTKQPDAEDAKVTQKTQKEYQTHSEVISAIDTLFTSNRFSFVFFLRLLRNLCVFCVRLFFSPSQQLQQGARI